MTTETEKSIREIPLRTCVACDGTGKQLMASGDPKHPIGGTVPCDACKGRGVVDASAYKVINAETECSPREIAVAFLEKWHIYESPVEAVELLIKSRDWRAAKLCDIRLAEISNYQTRAYRVARRELESIASAIRGKSNG